VQEFEPLFPTLEEPSQDIVGNVIDLSCGHASKPDELEGMLIHQHLVDAGFVSGITTKVRRENKNESFKRSLQSDSPIRPMMVPTSMPFPQVDNHSLDSSEIEDSDRH